MKKIVILSAAVIALIAASVVILNIYVKPRAENFIITSLKTYLGPDTEVGEVDLSLVRSQVMLKALSAPNIVAFPRRARMESGEISIKIDPSALIRKSLVFKEVRIEDLSFGLFDKKSPAGIVMGGESEGKGVAGGNNGIPFFFPADVCIENLILDNADFSFVDFDAQDSPVAVALTETEGGIEDLRVSLGGDCGVSGYIFLQGLLNSPGGGTFRLNGDFRAQEGESDFDFNLVIEGADLTRFSHYYEKTSLAYFKAAKVDLSSEASCVINEILARQTARIYALDFYGVEPESEDKLFGLPAETVIEFFEDLKGDITFNFDITGTIDDPQFHPGPVIKQVLSKALRDKILSKLQDLPREVIKMGEQAIKDLEVGDKIDEVEKEIDQIQRELKKIIEYEP